MKRSVIIQSSSIGMDIALLEDEKLVELHQDVSNQEYLVGDIYLGKVKKILSGLNAVFVDIGHEKKAFLHYHDLGPNLKNMMQFTSAVQQSGKASIDITSYRKFPEINKNGDITKVLDTEQQIIVQVAKEPISTKGHRLTSEITLPGRYIIIIPFSKGISVSKRIRDHKERKRLVQLFSDITPANFGIIVRTAAENRDGHILEKDLNMLLERWEKIVNNLANKETKLLGEYNKATSLLRDLLNDTFDQIVVDNENTYNELKDYLQSINPELLSILKLQSDKRPLFERYKIDKQIKSLFGKIINFGKGSYLVIEQTEAMTVIDVNSGSKSNKDTDREVNVLHVNLDAAEEIARQLRLRDIGGLIVVDFIDMRSHENQKLLYDKMKLVMGKDKTQHACTPISRFGLMEITRQRIKPAIDISIYETCPVCRGSGEVKPTILVVDDIEHSLNYISSELKIKSIVIRTHPFLAKYLNAGLMSQKIKWMLKYQVLIRIKPSQTLHLIDYKIYDTKGNNLEEF